MSLTSSIVIVTIDALARERAPVVPLAMANKPEDEFDAITNELLSWSAEEQEEVSDALRSPPETRRQVFMATVDIIRRRHAGQAPLPQDDLAKLIREKVGGERGMVAMTRKMLAEATTDDERRLCQSWLDDLRRRGFPMDDA